MTDYSEYQAEDFADDEHFLTWVRHPDEASDLFWNSFINDNPIKRAAVEEARRIVVTLTANTTFSIEERQEIWNNIERTLPEPKSRPAAKYAFSYAAAACLLLLFISGVFFASKYFFNTDIIVQSAFAQKKTVTLPDGSTVILNANSTLRFPERFTGDHVREVWISGEAFFDIKHLNKNLNRIKTAERFLVHADGMNIEVLGTAFNVLRRHSDTEVSLIRRKISLKFDDVPIRLFMKAGEKVNYIQGEKSFNTATGQTNGAVAWISNKIILNNTPLAQVVQKIEDNYGVKVDITDAVLATEKVTGEIPSNNLNVLLVALGDAINADIQKQGNEVTIKRAGK